NHDDYQRALNKGEEGLARFPEERGLLALRDLAQKQQHAAERKQFIDRQLTSARKLMEQGEGEKLVALLEAALSKIGTEPRLESLLAIVRENVEREKLERRKREYLHKAKDSLRKKAYQETVHILESARMEFKNDPNFESLLQFTRDEVAAENRR